MDTEASRLLSTSPTDEIAEQLLEAVPRLRRLMRAEAHESAGGALTPTQLRALGMLARGRRLPSELAREMEIAPASASEIVDLLVRRGLVERGDEPGDRRCTPLRVTAAGSAQWEAARQRAIGAISRLLDRMEPDELAALGQGLSVLVALLREKPIVGSEHAV